MPCIHCGNESKYKCPVCREPYCSLMCFKEHKQNPCSPPPEPPKVKGDTRKLNIDYEYPTEDTVPHKQLKLLEESTEVKKCLENPHVRKIIELLDQSQHPDELIQEYMQEPIFTEFVDACLKVVQPQEDTNQ